MHFKMPSRRQYDMIWFDYTVLICICINQNLYNVRYLQWIVDFYF
jgi:hypothetical protein